MEIPIVGFDRSSVQGTDPQQPRLPWQEFYNFRNTVLRAFRPFGTVGPMAECRITDEPDGPPTPWGVEADEPDFFVVDDWWSESQKYVLVQTGPSHISLQLIETLLQMLKDHAGWGVEITVDDGVLLIFSDRIMAEGRRFRARKTLSEIVQACRSKL